MIEPSLTDFLAAWSLTFLVLVGSTGAASLLLRWVRRREQEQRLRDALKAIQERSL